MFPEKLKKGDEIRVIASAVSMARLKKDIEAIARENLSKMGYKVTIGKNAYDTGLYNSASIESRVEDLHDAFLDPNVKCILTAFGGFSSNQILDYIDYDIIRNNPKILCGYSDITALANAIYRKTGLVTYSGPHFSTFGVKLGNEYTLKYFEKCVGNNQAYFIEPSDIWSDEDWFLDQDNRQFYKNEGPEIINEGFAEGTIIGGNLATLNLLRGSQYTPDTKDSILFIEDDKLSMPQMFDRDLQAMIHSGAMKGVKGIVIGKFQIDFNIKKEQIIGIIKSKKELDGIPIIIECSFGHTFPLFTFPIGGKARIQGKNGDVNIGNIGTLKGVVVYIGIEKV